MKKLFLYIFLLNLIIFSSNKVLAEDDFTATKETAAYEQSSTTTFEYSEISEQFSAIENTIKSNTFTKDDLNEYQAYLNKKEALFDSVIKEIDKDAKYTQDALDALGQAPKEGEPEEDESIKQVREKYTQLMTSYKNKQIEANLLKTEIARLTALITDARNQILIGNLVAEQQTIIDKNNFFSAFSDIGSFFIQIALSPAQWYQSLSANEKNSLSHNIWYILLVLIFVLSIGLFVKSFIITRFGYRHTDETPRYGQKISVAIVTAIAYGVIPCLLIGGCLLWQITNVSLTSSNFGIVLANLLYYALFVTLLRAVARVILAPWNGKWRLFNITDEKAERLFRATTLSIFLLGAIPCLINIAKYFNVSNELKLLLEVSNDAIKAFVIILLTSRIFEENKPKDNDTTNNENQDQQDETDDMGVSFRIIAFMSFFAITTFSISLWGYPDLATFIFNRFFFSALLLGVFIILKLLVSDLLRRGIVFWVTSFKLRRKLLSKADLAMSLITTPVLVICFLYSLLRLWGVPSSFMVHGLKKLIFGFKFGGIEISLIAIITGLIVFAVSLTLVRMAKKRLSSNLLDRINIDEGIKHSLVSGTGFIGIIISVILAITAMGVDLSNLAVIAGALSVGIGFGLQDVIKNLVSGIIILFERPFKVGDWVIIDGEEGKIKQINIRSTELETWTRKSVIIPNATLISSSLINLTHENNWQRQAIKVGVSYDSDADVVTKLLIECVKSSKKVAKNPAPYVIFKDFGSSSLDFEVRYYISDIWNGWSASSDIRYEILRRFRDENINIAYPQLVIHKSSEDTSIKGWQTNV
jgi:small-conductance mechanosensitive channel